MTASRTASTAPDPERPRTPRRARRILAGALATLLAAAGLTAIGAAPAMAAGPAVSAPAVPAAGGTITVTGSGFAATAPGIYLAVGPAGLGGFYQGAGSLLATETVWIAPGNETVSSGTARQEPMAADGTFTVQLTVPAPTESTPAYAIYTSKAHGQGFSDPSQNTITALSYAAPEPTNTAVSLTSDVASVQEGAAVALTATVTPAEAAGTVTFSEGSTTLGTQPVASGTAALTTSALSVGTHGITASFAPSDGGAYTGSTSAATTVTVTAAPQPTGPTIVASPASGIAPVAGTTTATGSGFSTTGTGFYIGVGPKSAKDNADWFTNASYYQGVKWATTAGTYGAKINADGTVSIALSGLKRVFTSNGAGVDCAAVECGVFTFAAHGSADRSQDTYTPIAFAAPKSTTLTVSSSASSVVTGTSVTLTATVDPAAVGSVEFFDGSTSLGTSAIATGTTATLDTSALAVGSHQLSAVFTPTDPTVATASTASAITVTVTATAVPAVAVSPTTGIDPAGGSVTVSGTGFSTAGKGFYIGIGPKSAKDNADWYSNSKYYQGVKWATTAGTYGAKINADGTFSITLTGLKRAFTSNGAGVDCAATECGVYTFASGGSTDRSQDTYTPIAFAAPTTTAVTVSSSASSVTTGTAVTFTATVTPVAAGTVKFFDGAVSLGSTTATSGVASLSTSTLGVGSHAITAAFTPTDATVAAPATSAATTVTVNPAGVPTVSAPQIPAGGGTITVTGSGFSTADPGIYLGLGPAGLRGFYADSGKLIPSETVWIAVGNPDVTSGTTRTAPLKADGTFTVTVTVPAASDTVPAYALYTSKAHGQGNVDRTQDTTTALSYAAPGTAITPTITLTTSGGTGNAGDPVDVTVRVTPAADGTITLLDNGKVVARDVRLVPDVTAAPTARVAVFAALAASSSSVTVRVPGLAAGTHAFSASFSPDDPDLFTPVVSPQVPFVVQPAAVATPEAPAPVAAAQPTCVARAVSGASLDWGVKTSFRNYISGGIANGSWTLAGVTYSGGQYGWTGGKGTFNPDETRGLVRYSGSVSFTGHDGVLNLVLSNLAVRVTSPTQATLIADVHSTDMGGKPSDFSGVSFATIALGGGTASGSTYSVDGAATALTADGAQAFAGFYKAGDALDPISFRFPLGAEVPCDSTTTSGLASTGSAGAGSVPLFGGLLILAGIAAVAVVRRRATRADAEVL
ncbi:HtaA domain-containing protein [Leifsonia aquatica]|uniref:HtaA domain-containing protein n=1 Tax=Leifsonia aquatica TaxID=144185 RepID=UPI00046AE130|nr:HtaA domain-containing protein [Leifsonia aquatica]